MALYSFQWLTYRGSPPSIPSELRFARGSLGANWSTWFAFWPSAADGRGRGLAPGLIAGNSTGAMVVASISNTWFGVWRAPEASSRRSTRPMLTVSDCGIRRFRALAHEHTSKRRERIVSLSARRVRRHMLREMLLFEILVPVIVARSRRVAMLSVLLTAFPHAETDQDKYANDDETANTNASQSSRGQTCAAPVSVSILPTSILRCLGWFSTRKTGTRNRRGVENGAGRQWWRFIRDDDGMPGHRDDLIVGDSDSLTRVRLGYHAVSDSRLLSDDRLLSGGSAHGRQVARVDGPIFSRGDFGLQCCLLCHGGGNAPESSIRGPRTGTGKGPESSVFSRRGRGLSRQIIFLGRNPGEFGYHDSGPIVASG